MARREKKKLSLWSMLCYLAIPQAIISIGIEIFVYRTYIQKGKGVRPDELKLLVFIAALVWFMIFLKNTIWIGRVDKFDLTTFLRPISDEGNEESERKHKAQHPSVPDEYISKVPDGLVLGADPQRKNRFVRVMLQKGNILNAIIMGAPGSGKSALLLSTLIWQLNHTPKKGEPEPMTFFSLDIKPELARKSCRIRGNKKVKVMNPMDRKTYGWDVFYNLTPNSTDDEIMAELDTIARALIDGGKDNRNEFFYESARTIMCGVLFYEYKQGKSFMEGLDRIMSSNISKVVSETLASCEQHPELHRVKALLSPYTDKEKSEAFQGIELAFRQSLSVFQTDSVNFFLDGNPRKASPLDLEDKISVFFSLPETKLEEMKCLLRLVTMQVMQHCSGRPESSHMLTLIIDEAARLGAINWVQFLSTSRSRQCATILAFQSISQMQTVWSKEQAKSLIELCRIVAVLSCTDTETARMMSDWAGEYKEKYRSYNLRGNNDNGESVSYKYEKILQPADIMTLQEDDEILLFIKGKYLRVRAEAARYYRIKQLNEISKKCVAYNDEKEKK